MRKKVWLDKNKKNIYEDDYLINDNGEKFKVVSIRNSNLCLLKQNDESIVKLNKSHCRNPYDSIDLKKDEYQLINFKLYK